MAIQRVWLILLLLGGMPAALPGQIVSGSIVGSVTDPSGGTIPGVKVVVTSQETNLTRSTITNDTGDYSFPSLPPGRYNVSASQPGFKEALVSGFELLIDQTARVDLKLEVGNLSEQVTVDASAVQLQTENPTLGQVIEEKPIVDLPLNGPQLRAAGQSHGWSGSGDGDQQPIRPARAHPDCHARRRSARELQ